MCKLLNTGSYYVEVTSLQMLSSHMVSAVSADLPGLSTDSLRNEWAVSAINSYLTGEAVSAYYNGGSWNRQYQFTYSYDSEDKLDGLSAGFSFKINATKELISRDANLSDVYDTEYAPKFGWHNPDGDDDVPDTLSREANEFFPTITTTQDNHGITRFDRDHLKKIGVVVYKMFVDPSENNKINFEAVEAYAGSLGRNDKDPTTGVTTFIDTIINTQSKYINFFSNCFNTPTGKKYYNDTLDMLVVQPSAKRQKFDRGDITTLGGAQNEIQRIYKFLGYAPPQIKTIDEARDAFNDLIESLETSIAKLSADS